MSRARRAASLGVVALLVQACGAADHELGAHRGAIISGADDRLDLYEVEDPLRSHLERGTVALMYAHRVAVDGSGTVALRAETAGTTLGLCTGEPFADQPSAAFCSGVLIDDDVVLTAAHCLGGSPDTAARLCPQIRVAFGYGLPSQGQPPVVTGEQLFECRRAIFAGTGGAGPSVAAIQLDRPATPERQPLKVVGPAAVVVGQRLIVASHGAGLPLKTERAAEVVAAAPDAAHFTAASDTFAGSSGGGLLDGELRLVGLVARGQADWAQAPGEDCRRAAVTHAPDEQHEHIGPLVSKLCAAGWPSPRLCARPPGCGDGVCSSSEGPESCAADCAPSRCGDSLCELRERGRCASDCSRYDLVPASWSGEPEVHIAATGTPDATSTQPTGCQMASGGGSAWSPNAWTLLVVVATSRWRRGRRNT